MRKSKSSAPSLAFFHRMEHSQFVRVGYTQASTVKIDGLKTVEVPRKTPEELSIVWIAGPNLPLTQVTLVAVPLLPFPDLSPIAAPAPSLRCHRPTVPASFDSGRTSSIEVAGWVAEGLPR